MDKTIFNIPDSHSKFKIQNSKFYSNIGLTLIEVLVAISVITILLTISIPNFSAWYSPLKLRGAQRELISNLRLTQQSAVTTQKNHLVRLNLIGKYYSVIKKDGGEQVVKTVYLPQNISFSSVILNPIPAEIEYNAAAVPNSTGEINLIDNKGDIEKIEVTPSGFVKGD